jgi:hypothetical protein
MHRKSMRMKRRLDLTLIFVYAASLTAACGGAGDSGGSVPDAGGDVQDPSDAGAEIDTSETALSGQLGALGDVLPTVSSFYIVNSGETLIYLTSATLNCSQLMTSRWLGAFSKDAQVVEIVIHGAPKVGAADHDAEVNYAAGGKSSAYEVSANTTNVKVIASTPQSTIEGTVDATYKSGSVSGTFHAQYCAGGQGY